MFSLLSGTIGPGFLCCMCSVSDRTEFSCPAAGDHDQVSPCTKLNSSLLLFLSMDRLCVEADFLVPKVTNLGHHLDLHLELSLHLMEFKRFKAP